MNGKQIFVLGAIAVVVILGGVLFVSSQNTNSKQPPEVAQETQQTNANNPETQNTGEQNAQAQNSSFSERYIAYSDENLGKATENNGRAIVFFHAGWCPMCQAAEKDFKANFDKVPADVTILKTDYDTATDLKAKYNITMQDTFVQVDSQGNEITKWNSGGEGIKTLLANVQ